VISNDDSVPIPIQGELEFARGFGYVLHFLTQLHTAYAHFLFESVRPHEIKADEDPPLLPSVLVDLVRPRPCVDHREEVVKPLDDERCPLILVHHLAPYVPALTQEFRVVRVVLVNDPGIVGLEVIGVRLVTLVEQYGDVLEVTVTEILAVPYPDVVVIEAGKFIDETLKDLLLRLLEDLEAGVGSDERVLVVILVHAPYELATEVPACALDEAALVLELVAFAGREE